MESRLVGVTVGLALAVLALIGVTIALIVVATEDNTKASDWKAVKKTDVLLPPVTTSCKVGIVSTSSPLEYSYIFNTSWKNVTFEQHVNESLAMVLPGLTAKFFPHLRSKWFYCAGTDQERAADFMAAIRDPEICWILAARGGWGAQRLLPYIDWDVVQQNPKIISGFSDMTTFLISVYVKTGIRTYYTPMGTSDFGGHEAFNRPFAHLNPGLVSSMLVKNELMVLDQPVGYVSPTSGPAYTIVSGKAQGRLVGGHLRQIIGLLGTDYLPQGFFKDAILLIELVNRQPRELDLCLSQLELAGILGEVKGIIWGDAYSSTPSNGNVGPDPSIRELVESYLKPHSTTPSFGGAFVGHTADDGQWSWPFGVMVELDADNHTVTLLERPMKV